MHLIIRTIALAVGLSFLGVGCQSLSHGSEKSSVSKKQSKKQSKKLSKKQSKRKRSKRLSKKKKAKKPKNYSLFGKGDLDRKLLRGASGGFGLGWSKEKFRCRC